MNRRKRKRLAIELAQRKAEQVQYERELDNKTISNLSRAIVSKGSAKKNGKSLSRYRRDQNYGGTWWEGPALPSMQFPNVSRYVKRGHVKTWGKQ